MMPNLRSMLLPVLLLVILGIPRLTPAPLAAGGPGAVASPDLSRWPLQDWTDGAALAASFHALENVFAAHLHLAQTQGQAAQWTPEDMTLECRNRPCPVAVGAVIFAYPAVKGKIFFNRCTAFLIAYDMIMTSGHCDITTSQAVGYFVTRTDIPERTYRKVTRTLFKKFTPSHRKDPEIVSGEPDIAVLALETPITTIDPLSIANGPQQIYSQLISYVINQLPSSAESKQSLDLTLDRIDCIVHRHERFFPYDIADAPAVIDVFDCPVAHGNSGAPLFVPNSLVVEAVIEGALDTDDVIPLHGGEATNLRCMDLFAMATIKCVNKSDDQILAEFTALEKRLLASLTTRTVIPETPFPVKFKNAISQLANPANPIEQEYEVFYLPACRVYDINPASIPAPIEQVKMVFDKWAVPRIVRTAITVADIGVYNRSGDVFQVAVNWPPPPGPFRSRDPRVQLGTNFWLALPICQ